jgi:ATP-binding cassette subfamily F protein 3
MAQSRRKQLEKMEITEKPHQMGYELKFRFEYDMEPYENVLTTKKLCVAAGGNTLIDGLNLEVLRGDRLVIAGANGTGKSTLLRVLCGKLRAQSGSIKVGTGVKMSVFEQQQRRRGGRVIDAIWDQYPRMTELEVRSHLARLNFKGEEVFKETATLSGGELSRLRFAEILLERPNLLFLDEPTNHLDIYTRESLGQALAGYTGTLLLVTHDRYLMNSLACPILHLEGGKGVFYEGYAALMAHTASGTALHTGKKEAKEAKTQHNPKEERRLRAEVRKQAKELEQRIEELGADILAMEESISQPEVASDHLRLQELCDALDDARFEQNERYAQWETLLEEHGDLLE